MQNVILLAAKNISRRFFAIMWFKNCKKRNIVFSNIIILHEWLNNTLELKIGMTNDI